jgi:hypothetical protein
MEDRRVSEGTGGSLVDVEYLPEEDTYRGYFDEFELPPSRAVTRVLGEVADRPRDGFEPLSRVVDTAALDQLCTNQRARPTDRAVSFTYLGHEVTVKSYGVVDVTPAAGESPAAETN